jgi:ubiquinone/menaquinone biosynthesis C-methylase UbiE
MKYDKRDKACVTLRRRVLKVMTRIVCNEVMTGKMGRAGKVFKALLPNLVKEMKSVLPWFVKLGKQVKVPEKMFQYLFNEIDPSTATNLHALTMIRENPKEAIKLMNAVKDI